jgi:DNA-directed RNA polymerase specialized sigma24 family protein
VSPEIRTAVYRTAARYKRRCWWASTHDLVQEGFLAVCEADRTYEPQVGVPYEAYVCRAVALAMKRALWKESAPVTGGQHRPEETLRGLHRSSRPTESLGDTVPSPERVYLEREWRALVRSRLDAHYPPHIVALLLSECTAKQAAAMSGTTQRRCYSDADKARWAIAGDLELWRLLNQRKA